jgi:cytochrome c biogenesis protein CcdA
MKKIFFILSIFLVFSAPAYTQNKPTVTLFHSSHCNVCLKLKEELLPPLREKYKDDVNWQMLNTDDSENLALLKSVTDYFQREQALVPSVLIGKNFLVGLYEIRDGLDKAIAESLSSEQEPLEFLRTNLVDVFKKLSVPTVIASGLIDGINPCAFAVIVFFISFLAVYGYKKKEIILVGTFYCLAVFISYLLIGLGAFELLYSLRNIYLFVRVFYYFTGIFCLIMGVIALYDYFRFKKTKSSQDAILQLPKFIKKRINITIGSNLRQRKSTGVLALAITSFVVGFLVSLLEAVCTGQVYIPIIVFILKNTDLKIRAAAYLILYNLMFIFPLALIFILSLVGVSHSRFNDLLKRHLGAIKIAMAFVFFLLGIFILILS